MKSKIVLTSAVAGAMAMGAVTGVIFPSSSARALDLGGGTGAGTSVSGSSTSSTTTNNDASAGTLATNETGASTAPATTGADTDTRMRQATSRQSGSRGSILSDTNEGATASSTNTDTSVNAQTDTDARIRDADSRATGSEIDAADTPTDTTPPTDTSSNDPSTDPATPPANDNSMNTTLDSSDALVNSESQTETDARMRDAESRMSGSRGSLQSDTTAGADPDAALRAQIRSSDNDATIGVSTETDATVQSKRSGGLLGLFRGNDEVEATGGTDIGASGDLQR